MRDMGDMGDMRDMRDMRDMGEHGKDCRCPTGTPGCPTNKPSMAEQPAGNMWREKPPSYDFVRDTAVGVVVMLKDLAD